LVDLASGERVNLADHLALLIEANHDLVGDAPATDVLQHLGERFAQAFGLAHVDVWTWDTNDGPPRLAAHVGGGAGHAAADAPPDGNATRWRALNSASLLPSQDAAGGAGSDGAAKQLAAPLRIGANAVGVVVGDRGGEPVTATPAQLQFAQALANQATLALELQRLRTAAGEAIGSARS
jgi:GAF domain-containing protein